MLNHLLASNIAFLPLGPAPLIFSLQTVALAWLNQYIWFVLNKR